MRSIKSILTLLLLLLPASAMAQSGPFLDLTAIRVGSGPNGVAIGDLNGDGIPDMAVANYNDSTVSIALGNGDGSFKQATTISVATSPAAVAIADLNHDGKADLVVATMTGAMQSFLGNGDGTFGSPSLILSPEAPATGFPALQIADLNGDGKPDIAFVVEYSNSTTGVSILLGAGDGTFTLYFGGANTTLRFPGTSQLQSLAVGDFDGNGTNDIAFTVQPIQGGNGLIYILLNNGAGGFTFGSPISIAGAPYGVTVGKFTSSGHLDVAVATPPNVALLAGNGNGTFQAPTYSATGQFPVTVSATDLNGDGNLDLVTNDYSSNKLFALIGKGDGTFQTAVSYPTLSGPFFTATADLNGDGRADVVVADGTQNTVQVFLASSAGSLFTGSYPTGANPALVATGDFNGDGISDIAVYNPGDDSISTYLANANGGFALSQISTACGFTNGYRLSLVSGHFLNRKSDSIAVNCGQANEISATFLYSLDANGNWVGQNVGLNRVLTVNAGDFNGDGLSELLESSGEPGPDFLPDIYIVGTFNGEGQSYGIDYPGDVYGTLTGDFNGDGRTDFIVTASAYCSVSLSTGGLNFNTIGGTTCGALAIGDFNGDGLDDIVQLGEYLQFYSLTSNGDGTFSPGKLLTPITNGNASDNAVGAVADFNGDGVPDVIVATGSGVSMAQGVLDGSFSEVRMVLPASLSLYSYTQSSAGDWRVPGRFLKPRAFPRNKYSLVGCVFRICGRTAGYLDRSGSIPNGSTFRFGSFQSEWRSSLNKCVDGWYRTRHGRRRLSGRTV
jgi:FG-GAP-like repeat/FG-GAP repeat